MKLVSDNPLTLANGRYAFAKFRFVEIVICNVSANVLLSQHTALREHQSYRLYKQQDAYKNK